MHVGVISVAQPGWTAGVMLTRVMVEALAQSLDLHRERLSLLASDDAMPLPSGVSRVIVRPPSLSIPAKVMRHALRVRDRRPSLPGEWQLRGKLHLIEPSDPVHVARAMGIDVIAPALNAIAPGIDIRRVGWIPDFQHRHLPQFFGADEVTARTEEYGRLAARAERIILSSRTVEGHFREEYPEHAGKVRVASFPSIFAYDPPAASAEEARAAYGLPDRFAIVVNQLWAHKNHAIVVDAVARAAALGARVPVVMVGTPSDYRDPRGRYLSSILQHIARAGVSDRVLLLGEVPRDHLVGLLRAASLVIQPSRWEGWSTTVEDAKALGKPLMCSDIAVHREQAPRALGFFGCDAPEALGALLAERFPTLPPGPDRNAETMGLAAAKEAARAYGLALATACREAMEGDFIRATDV